MLLTVLFISTGSVYSKSLMIMMIMMVMRLIKIIAIKHLQ